MKTLYFSLALAFGFSTANAQEISESEYNPLSLRPVRNADAMLKNTIWSRMDLREKMNEPMFAKNAELAGIIIQAVKDGLLKPYTNDQLNQRMAYNDFLANLKLPVTADDETSEEWSEPSWTTDETEAEASTEENSTWDEAKTTTSEAAPTDEFFAKQMTVIEIKTDVIYDKKRGQLINDIQSISIIIPGDNFSSGLDRVVATFSYKELVENVFRDNPNAIWYNANNLSESRNLADAFDLLLMEAHIIKYANPKDQFIADTYMDPKEALGHAQSYQHQQMERIATLYSE